MALKTTEVSLSKIVLLNTLRIKHQQVFLDGNSHISGKNNFGKTSFLRIMAYLFSGGDRKALGLDDRMKSYNDFYFPHRNVNMPNLSIIVYEFRVKEKVGEEVSERFFTVTVYCTSKPKFIFVDCAYDPNNYINLEINRQWESLSIIEDKLLSAVGRDVQRYFRTENIEDFMNILFGCPSAKITKRDLNMNMLRRFSYFVPKYSNDFDPSTPKAVITKVLTRIICPPNQKKDSLNDLMEYLLSDQDNGQMNLKEIRGDIAKYKIRYNAFMRWKSPESRSAQKAISNNYSSYVEARKNEATILARLRYAYNSARNQLVILESQLAVLDDRISSLENAISQEDSSYQSRKQELTSKIAVLRDQLDRLKRKHDEYAPYIARKDEFEGIPNMEAKKQSLASKLSVLRAGKSEIESVFLTTKNELEKIYSDYYGSEYLVRKHSLDVAVSAQRDKLNTRLYDVEYDEIEKKYSEMRTALAESIATLKSKISDCEAKIEKIDQFCPLQQAIAAKNQVLVSLKADLKQVEDQLSLNAKNILSKKDEAEALPEQRNQRYDYRIQSLLDTKTRAEKELERIAKNIDEFNESFAGWLTENRPGWETTIGRVAREEVLAAKDLNPVVESEDGNLFGVSIDVSGVDFGVNTLANLREKEAQATQNLKRAEADHAAAVAEANNWLASERQRISDEISALEATKKELVSKRDEISRDLNVASGDCARLNGEQDELRRKMLEGLKSTRETSKSDLASKQQSAATIESEIRAEKDKRKAAVETELKAYEVQVNQAKVELDKERSSRQVERDAGILSARNARDARLRDEGIDTKEIERLESSIDSLDKAISALKKEEKEFYIPAKNFESTEYVLYPEKLSEYESRQAEEQGLIEAHKAFVSSKGEELKQARSQKASLDTKSTTLAGDIAAVDKRFKPVGSDTELSEKETSRIKAFETVIPMETTDGCSQLLSEMSTNVFLIDEKRQRMNVAIRKLWSMFGANYEQREVLFGKDRDFTDDTVDDMERFSAMYDYINENRANTIIGICQNEARILLTALDSCKRSWEDYIVEIDKQVNQLNAELRNINLISNIRRIEIRRRNKPDSLVANLDVISSIASEAFDHYDFFAEKSNRFYRIMDDLDCTLQSRSEPVLKAIDSVKLEMRMDEGMNIGEWFDTFEVGGSSGTRFFAKNFFYVALLKSLVRKFARDGWSTHFPLIFDEVGTLSNNYMEQFLVKAKDAGFNCITAQPSVSWNVDLSIYNQEYEMVASKLHPDYVVIVEMFRKQNTYTEPDEPDEQ